MVSLPGPCREEVSVGTGWPGVSDWVRQLKSDLRLVNAAARAPVRVGRSPSCALRVAGTSGRHVKQTCLCVWRSFPSVGVGGMGACVS